MNACKSLCVCLFLCGAGLVPVQGAEVALVPVSATTPYSIDGNEITVSTGDTTVTLEIRIGGWDPDLDGHPELDICQVSLDASGYTSGSTGSLSVARIPCTTDDDCFTVSLCEDTGFCSIRASAFIDSEHPNFAYFGMQAITAVDVSQPDFRYGATVFMPGVGIADPGEAKYFGTLILDVSPDATGTFTVALRDDSGTFLTGADGQRIEPLDFSPALITVAQDCNGNGVPDPDDIASGTSDDCNENGRPDECEADCNDNGVADECDVAQGASSDCNSNDVPDECESDCNDNGVADECDVAGGTSNDCNDNIVPDECEPGWDLDCNSNGQPDLCDLFDGTDTDCNGNAVPDECDITAGTSEDCTENGTPDECEPDCNRTGLADSCDILNGTSEDADGDGVPDECIRGFSLMPVSATTGHLLDGNEIIVPMGGTRVTLEVRASGWDPDLDGVPDLYLFQATIDSSGYTSGDTGSLDLAQKICATNDDCFADSICESDGFCHDKGVVYTNRLHPNFVFFGFQANVGSATSTPDVIVGGLMTGEFGVPDPGVDQYVGTLILDVPPDATGTFTVGFLDDPHSFLRSAGFGLIEPLDLAPALITVLEDCNGNGVRDDIDIADGTSEDVDGNGIPDECEAALPAVVSKGGRYLQVTPKPDPRPVALRVTSPQFPCLTQYVASSGGVGRLVDSPMFATAEDWGTVPIIDPRIVPGITYQVRAVFENGDSSLMAAAATLDWGDVKPPWGDLSLEDVGTLVEGFEHQPEAAPVEMIDLHPRLPDGVVDFDDILASLDAYLGLPFPFEGPCAPTSQPRQAMGTFAPADVVTLTLRLSKFSVRPGGALTADLFASTGGGTASLRGYQASVLSSGGRSGQLELENVHIDPDHPGFVFAEAESIAAMDLVDGRLGAALISGDAPITEPVYLGTFTFRASRSARGRFDLAVRADGLTFLRDTANAPVPYQVSGTAPVWVKDLSRH